MSCLKATWSATLVTVALAVAAAPPAFAQDVPPEVKIAPVTEGAETELPLVDLQNIVTSATKTVSSVQETPAIVTIITSEDIRLWGYRTLEDVLSDLPGWFRYGTAGLTIPSVTVRGMVQAMLVLRDGVPTLDPFANLQVLNRSLPLESIKRIEAVTGPGGVLWGANSFLGVVNIITKDAEDINGVETGGGYGDGRGNRSDFRGYGMVGTTLLDGRVKAFIHASYENYVGQELTVRQFLAGAIPPQPSGGAIFGPIETSDSPRSWVYNVDGKISAGPLSLYWLWSDGELRWGGTFPIGALAPVPGGNFDPNGTSKDNVVNRFDRVVALEYRSRDRIGIDAKAYLTETFFQFGPLLFFPASSLVQGGVVGETAASPFRLGMTLDSDFTLGAGNRVLWG